tara:strand:- start:1485 stop:2420 length:936 start_codon:yes stop_codon:yes gene_type:complete
MALTEGMREQIAKDSGVRDPFAKGDKAAAKIIATMAELGLTGGVIGAGGKLVYKGIKGARAMAEARKAIAAAKKLKQAKKTKPAASAKPKTETGRTTVMPKKGRSVTTTTRTSPKTTTQPKKPMKTVRGTDKPSVKKAVKSPPKAPPKAPAKKGPTKVQKAAAGVVGLAVLERATRKKDEAKASTLKTKEGGPGRKAGEGKTKPKASYQPANAGRRKGPQYQPGNAGSKNRKSGAGTAPDKAKEGAKQKRTNISASKNTGFGPGGNLFPSSDADRRRLMKIWGGTGSKAAAAAKDGSQGTWLADSKKRKKK